MPSKKNVPCICKACGEPFLARFPDVQRGKAIFCCRSCASSSRRPVLAGVTGENNPNWKGGITWSSKGYCYVLIPDHPYANNNGYIRRAKLAMEKLLGRYLIPGEIVHHKDGNKWNDTPGNLELTNASAHSSYHGRTRGRKPKSRKPNSPSNRRYSWPDDAVLLEWRKNRTLRDIANEIGCNFKTVDRRVHRIKNKLGLD